MIEQWKTIDEFPQYSVSNLGRVKNNKTNRIMVGGFDKDGYKQVTISHNKHQYNRRICRLVAIAFIPNPNNYSEVNHKDFDKSNNFVENLEWVSEEQNKKHYNLSLRKKLIEKKRKKYFSNKTYEFIYNNKNKILNLYDSGYTVEDISNKLNIGKDTIASILSIFDRL